jgi:hypothetical protein
MALTDCRTPVLSVDDEGEPIDMEKKLLSIGGVARVVWFEGVIDPVQSFEGFKAQLEAWHRENNPHLFFE